MKKLKIQGKLMVLTVPLMLLAAALVICFTMYMKNIMNRSTDLYYSQLYEGNSSLINADRDFYQAYTALLEYIVTTTSSTSMDEESLLADFDENIQQTDDRVNALTAIITKYPDLAAYKFKTEGGETVSAAEQIKAFNANINKLREISGGALTVGMLEEFDPVFNATRDNISNIEDLIEDYASVEKEELSGSINKLMVQIIIIVLIVIAVIAVIAIRVMMYIHNGLEKVTTEIESLSKKDLTCEETSITGVDEIAQLSRAADGLKQELTNVMRTLNNSSNELSDASNSMAVSTGETGQSVQSIDEAASELAHAATQQAQDVTQMVNEVANIDTISKKSKEDTNTLANACKDIEKITKTGMNTVIDLTNITEKSMEAYNSIFNVIEGIDEKTKNIGVASDMITAIATQTNLLSLNASIEAARAGEAGRGFAVVADEIRQLAEQSASSADTINTMLNELIKSAAEASEESSRVKEYVERQRQSVVDTKAGFTEIVNNVEIVNEGVAGLREVNENLGDKVSTISKLVESISAISEENAATAEELSATTSTVANNMSDIETTGKNVNEASGRLSSIVAEYEM